MADPAYVTVRRPSDAPFEVLPADLIAEDPRGYDLDLMRSVALDGLETPITVRPAGGGLFDVIDGGKRLAVIRMLVRLNKMVHDTVRGVSRPAKEVFALVRCRVQKRRP